MQDINTLFANNRAWSKSKLSETPEYFSRLVHQQSPEYLWIGCSDSRVPANQIIGLAPGEVFVHRNIANLVTSSDINALSVVQYAVDVLQVKHILVVGHYGCSGVHAAWHNTTAGLAHHWLHPIRELRERHRFLFGARAQEEQNLRQMCELNVLQQVVNICRTVILANAWMRKQNVTVHGWCYDLADGLIRDLYISVRGYQEAVDRFNDIVQGWMGKDRKSRSRKQ
jgi:Carbonic anhydrase